LLFILVLILPRSSCLWSNERGDAEFVFVSVCVFGIRGERKERKWRGNKMITAAAVKDHDDEEYTRDLQKSSFLFSCVCFLSMFIRSMLSL
jgi:hypothetical protein